jgi:hypothetical protein
MAYVAMTRFANRTLIAASPSERVLRHAPLPWPGGKRFPTRDIRGLHTETRTVHAKGHSVDEAWTSIVRPNGKKAMLVKGLEMTDPQMSHIAGAVGEYLAVPHTFGRE